jgi:hypothetical protein
VITDGTGLEVTAFMKWLTNFAVLCSAVLLLLFNNIASEETYISLQVDCSTHKMALVSAKKAALLGSLYLAQTVPKGYLKFLPVLMAEKGESMLVISSVALFSIGDWLKPLFGAMIDMKRVSSLLRRKLIIVSIQLAVILVFGLSYFMEKPQLVHLAALFSLCSFLTSMHDTAVDGLAVQLLNEDEQAVGGFGQYAGYKLGSLLTGGILPSIVGTNHRMMCIGVMVPMLIVLLFTLQFDLSQMQDRSAATMKPTQTGENASTAERPDTRSSLTALLKSYFTTFSGLQTVLMLLAYKFADHGLDFIWSPMLVHANFNRKTIVQTQFVLGTVAAMAGAMYGSAVCKAVGSASKALAYCAILRIVPNLMQLWFAHNKASPSHIGFIATHAVLENIAGSAVTGAMFALLLEKSDPLQPATSYAVLNTIALVGMSIGEFSLSQLSHYYGFRAACAVGVVVNVLFPVLALSLPSASKKDE